MKLHRFFLMAIITIMVLVACAPANQMPTVVLPAGQAFAEGKEIFFVHTETSDTALAELLSKMMSSPVLHVPALASVPAASLAKVYVFDNGLKGMGPLGFQADVFDNPPGSAGYSPLRQVNIVSWANPSSAWLLKSAAEVNAALTAGEVTIKQPGAVVNMPFVVWDGGKR